MGWRCQRSLSYYTRMQAHPLTPPTCIGLAAAHACEFALEGSESALHLGLQLAQVHDQLLVVRDAPHSGRVVVVTALCDPQVQATAQAAGAAATLLKTEALEQLEHWLSQG